MGEPRDRRTQGLPRLPWMIRGNLMHRLLRRYAADPDFQRELETLYRNHEGLFPRGRLRIEREILADSAGIDRERVERELRGFFISDNRLSDLAIHLHNMASGKPVDEGLTSEVNPEKLGAYIRDVLRIVERWKLGMFIEPSATLVQTRRTVDSRPLVRNGELIQGDELHPLLQEMLENSTILESSSEDAQRPAWLAARIQESDLDPTAFAPLANWNQPFPDQYAGIEAMHEWFVSCHTVRPADLNLRELVATRFSLFSWSGGGASIVPLIDATSLIKVEIEEVWDLLGAEPWDLVVQRLHRSLDDQLAAKYSRLVEILESTGY